MIKSINIYYTTCVFFYTKLYFNDEFKIGSTVDFEIQFQKDYSNTYWTQTDRLLGKYYPTSPGIRFNVEDMSEASGIDIIANANKEMKAFNSVLECYNRPAY